MLKLKTRFMSSGQRVGKRYLTITHLTTRTIGFTRFKALVHPNATEHISPLPSLTAFLVTLTEMSYSSDGEWAMETSGGIWPTETVLTRNEEIIIESNQHLIPRQVQVGSAMTKPKVLDHAPLWATLQTNRSTIHSLQVNT